MQSTITNYLPAASFLMAALALGFSLVAAFPGLKTAITAVRDGILWLALFFVLGGAAYISIHALESNRQKSPANERARPISVERP
jgi:hypothetical protein